MQKKDKGLIYSLNQIHSQYRTHANIFVFIFNLYVGIQKNTMTPTQWNACVILKGDKRYNMQCNKVRLNGKERVRACLCYEYVSLRCCCCYYYYRHHPYACSKRSSIKMNWTNSRNCFCCLCVQRRVCFQYAFVVLLFLFFLLNISSRWLVGWLVKAR